MSPAQPLRWGADTPAVASTRTSQGARLVICLAVAVRKLLGIRRFLQESVQLSKVLQLLDGVGVPHKLRARLDVHDTRRFQKMASGGPYARRGQP